MSYARTAGWLRPRLWFGWWLGRVPWVVWVASLAIGGWTHDAEGTLLGIDHLAFYSAARHVRDGTAGAMYDYDALGPYQGGLVGRPDWGGLVGFRNPPFYALLYLPTAGLSFFASNLIWMAVGLELLVAAVYLLRPDRPWRTILRALTFYPVFATVSFGQNSLLSLGVFAAVYRLTTDGRPFAAGLVAGLLWFKPPLLLGLFVWWGLNPARHARSWAGVIVTGAVLAGVSWLAVPDGSRAFVDTLARNVGYGGEAGWNKQSARAFWTLLLPDAPAGVTWALTGATAAAGLGVGVWVARRTGAPVAVMFPVAVFLSLWLSPHALIYEWAVLVPAAVVLWQEFPDRRDGWVVLFAVAWVVLMVSTPLALVQIRYLDPPAVVQVAVPVMGWVGWRAARELAAARSGGAQAVALDDHPGQLDH